MLVIKVGGGADINLSGIAHDLAQIHSPCIVVHGANSLRNTVAHRMGIELKVLTSVSGYSSVFTDDNAMDLLMMAYAGLRNKRIVELLRRSGVDAIGLTGLDGGLIRARRKKGIKAVVNGRRRIYRDYSGKPVAVRTELLLQLIRTGFVPVLTVPIADENGCAVSTDNDEIVALLSESLPVSDVIQLIEAPGFLANEMDPDSLVPALSFQALHEQEQRATGRFQRKLRTLKRISDSNRARITIADGRREHPVLDALSGMGTVIQ